MKMKPLAELKSAIDAAGIKKGTPIVTTCGSGITACILSLSLQVVGRTDVAVYDGSWTEWGRREDVPIEV
jgi:thiosulfate/3-mercaptopyruvate sulfurtransferase